MKYPRLIISFATDGIIAMQFSLFIHFHRTHSNSTHQSWFPYRDRWHFNAHPIMNLLHEIQWTLSLSLHIVARGQKPIRTEMDVSNVDIVSSICCGSSVGGGDAIRFMCHEPNWCNTIFPSTHTPPRAPQNAIKLVAVHKKHNSRTTIHILYFYVCVGKK